MTWPGRTTDRSNRGRTGGHGMVRLAGTDTVVPSSVTRTLEGDNGHPDLVMTFELRDGRPECVELHIKAKPKGRGIKQSDLRGFTVDELAEVLFSRAAMRVEQTAEDGTWIAKGPLWEERERWAARGDVAERLSAKRGGVSTAELERVAEVYSNHRDNKPVQAVQMLVGYASRRTASRRIQQARQVGFLTPAGTAEATAEDQAPALKAPMRLPSTPQEVEDQIARYEEQGRPDLAAGLLELRQAMQRKETD
jgi:hypothetical protein